MLATTNDLEATTERSGWWARWPFWIAVLTVLAWYAVLSLAVPRIVGDEIYHVPVVRALFAGDPPPREVPMPITYHWLVAQAGRIVQTDSLAALRAVQVVFALAALSVYCAVFVQRRAYIGWAPLLFVWNPLVFPFLALVYTDIAALLALLSALHLHRRRWYFFTAVFLLVACALRQSCIVWIAFLIVWRLVEVPDPTADWRQVLRVAWRTVWREWLWLYALLIVLLGVYWLYQLDAVALRVLENRPAVNPAQFYLFALTLALVWLPTWGRVAWRLAPRAVVPLLARGRCVALLAAGFGLLLVAYHNPHPWNQDLAVGHNVVLRLLDTSMPARLLVAVVILSFVVTQLRHTRHNAARRPLLTVWVFSLLYLAPHYPVDPRYYLIPLVLLDLFTPVRGRGRRRQVLWYGVLSVMVTLAIVLRPGPWGGL